MKSLYMVPQTTIYRYLHKVHSFFFRYTFQTRCPNLGHLIFVLYNWIGLSKKNPQLLQKISSTTLLSFGLFAEPFGPPLFLRLDSSGAQKGLFKHCVMEFRPRRRIGQFDMDSKFNK